MSRRCAFTREVAASRMQPSTLGGGGCQVGRGRGLVGLALHTRAPSQPLFDSRRPVPSGDSPAFVFRRQVVRHSPQFSGKVY